MYNFTKTIYIPAFRETMFLDMASKTIRGAIKKIAKDQNKYMSEVSGNIYDYGWDYYSSVGFHIIKYKLSNE